MSANKKHQNQKIDLSRVSKDARQPAPKAIEDKEYQAVGPIEADATEPVVETTPAEMPDPATETGTETILDAQETTPVASVEETNEVTVPEPVAEPTSEPVVIVNETPEPKPVVEVVEPNFKVYHAVYKDLATALATSKGMKMVFLIGLLGLTDGDSYVVYEDTTQMSEGMAKVITSIEENNPTAIIKPAVQTPVVESGKKGKTQGIFEITSNFNPAFSLRGSSSQIEICTRDYMSWCLKDKAPKSMQAEYDRAKKENKESDPKKIFNVAILKSASKPDDLKSAKEEFGLSNKGGKPQGTANTDAKGGDKSETGKNGKVVTLSPEEALKAIQTLDAKQAGKPAKAKPEEKTESDDIDNKVVSAVMTDTEMYRRYKEGMPVDEICKLNNITSKVFYEKMYKFK